MGKLVRAIPLLLLSGVFAATGLAWAGLIKIPRQYDPFAPLDLRAEPNFLTPLKLARLERDPGLCRMVLGDAPLRFTPVPNRASSAGCSIQDAVQVARSGVRFSAGFTATCPPTAAWMLFEIHALQPAAQRRFGQPVVRVIHLGTYACRNIYGRQEARRSEHARANAIDVSGFVLQDGTRISIGRDWNGTGQKAAFLHDLRTGACRFFDTVLSPDYNAAHRDHLHFDMGTFWACR